MYLTEQNPHGGDVYETPPLIDFSANLNPEGMPGAVRQALLDAVDRCVSYPDPYCRALRRALSQAEGVPAEHILCGAGASELIFQYAAALPKEKPALIIAPAFSDYAAALMAAGHRAESFILKGENGFRLGQELFSLDLSRYAAVFLCSPANPTGAAVDPALLKRLAETGVPLLCDFSFLDLTEAPERYGLPALISRFPNVAALRSPTKSFAIPGVRLGYLMSADLSLLERMSALGQCWNVSVPAQMAGIAAAECGAWLRASAVKIARERERMSRELRALGLTVFPGEANFLLLYSEKELIRPLREKGILLRDCSNYVGLTKGYIRTAVRTPAENDRLLAAVREVLS